MKKWKERIGLRNHNKKTRNQDKRKQEIIPKERKKIERVFLTDENKSSEQMKKKKKKSWHNGIEQMRANSHKISRVCVRLFDVSSIYIFN